MGKALDLYNEKHACIAMFFTITAVVECPRNPLFAQATNQATGKKKNFFCMHTS